MEIAGAGLCLILAVFSLATWAGLIPIDLSKIHRKQHEPIVRWTAATVAIAALVGSCTLWALRPKSDASGSLAISGSASDAARHSTNTPTRTSVEITPPSQAAFVTKCAELSGTVTLSDGEGLWIYVEGSEPPVYYLQGQAKLFSETQGIPTGWDSNITLGGKIAKNAEQFTIVAVVLDSAMTKYQKGMLLVGQLADQSLPPEIAAKATVHVVRMPGTDKGNCPLSAMGSIFFLATQESRRSWWYRKPRDCDAGDRVERNSNPKIVILKSYRSIF